MRLVPAIVTVVPPAVGPAEGLTLVTVGAAMYVYWSAALVVLVPPGVVTVTSTVADPGGDVAVMCDESTTVTFVAPFAPKSTAVAPVRFVPVIITPAPPEAGPEDGLIAVIVGG